MNSGSNPDFSISPRFQVRQCTRETCRLRFSVEVGDRKGDRCPICRADTLPVALEPQAPELADEAYPRAVIEREVGRATGPELEVLLDNIRSAWNVGSMLRTCDGAGVRFVHLCGVSATPDHPKVPKTALGAEKSLPWRFHPDGVEAVREMKSRGLRVWALEGGERAESLFDLSEELPGDPLVLVAGNELTGVDPGILALCDRVVCLPMQGIKGSLNVAVAFGIAVYAIRFGARAGELVNDDHHP